MEQIVSIKKKPKNTSKSQGYAPHYNDNNYKLKGFALLQI